LKHQILAEIDASIDRALRLGVAGVRFDSDPYTLSRFCTNVMQYTSMANRSDAAPFMCVFLVDIGAVQLRWGYCGITFDAKCLVTGHVVSQKAGAIDTRGGGHGRSATGDVHARISIYPLGAAFPAPTLRSAGSIPSTLGGLAAVKKLSLWGNQLSGG